MLVAGAESVTWQTLGSAGELAAGIAASIAIPFAWRQLHNQRVLAREARVYAYVDRLSDVDLLPLLAEARNFWIYGSDKGPAQGMIRWDEMTRLERHRIVAPMNLLEEVADQYMAGLLDKELVKRLFKTAAVGYFEEAEWFIKEMRRTREEGDIVYDQWQAMVKDFAKDPEPG